MIKNYFILLSLILINGLYSQTNAMEFAHESLVDCPMPDGKPVDNKNNHNNPLVSNYPPRDGVCHLQKLPRDILNHIASYLLFLDEETDSDFELRIKNTASSHINYRIIPLYGEVHHTKNNSLAVKKTSNTSPEDSLSNPKKAREYLIVKSGADNSSGDKHILGINKDKSFIQKFAVSQSKRIVVDLQKSEKQAGPNTIGMQYNYLVGINIINLETNVPEKLSLQGLPSEIVSFSSEEDHSSLNSSKNHYDFIQRDAKNFARALNPFSHIAISSQQKFVIIANNSTVYIATKNAQNEWQPFTLLKQITDLERSIRFLLLNKQETKLALFRTESRLTNKLDPNTVDIIPIQSDRVKTLSAYFRQRRICVECKSVYEKIKKVTP